MNGLKDMSDAGLYAAIRRMLEEQRALRADRSQGLGDPVTHMGRIRDLDGELDQCWDLLRQRRAQRAAGRDSGAAEVRAVDRVRSYRQ
jgi:hypothetical protein